MKSISEMLAESSKYIKVPEDGEGFVVIGYKDKNVNYGPSNVVVLNSDKGFMSIFDSIVDIDNPKTYKQEKDHLKSLFGTLGMNRYDFFSSSFKKLLKENGIDEKNFGTLCRAYDDRWRSKWSEVKDKVTAVVDFDKWLEEHA